MKILYLSIIVLSVAALNVSILHLGSVTSINEHLPITGEPFGQLPSSLAVQPTLSAGIGVSGNSNPAGFVHGDIARFSGWSNGYLGSDQSTNRALLTTPNTNFTIDIVNPENVTIFHQKFTADKQGSVSFSLPIKNNFTFGEYDVLYSVQSQGYKTITPYSPDPDVHYYPARFFVVWSSQDLIEARNNTQNGYKFQILQPGFNGNISRMVQVPFGSVIDLNATMCPSPLDSVSNTSFVFPNSRISKINQPKPAIEVRASLIPDDTNVSPPPAENFFSNFVNQDTCTNPIQISSGFLAKSGKWSVNASAYWVPSNDPTHVYQVKSNRIFFDVANTTYRSDNVVPILLDQSKYPHAIPLDWSPDSKSILFTYQTAVGESKKLGILDLQTRNVMELDPFAANLGKIIDHPEISSAKFLPPSGDKIAIVFGKDLFIYNIPQNATARLTAHGKVNNLDVTSDGRLFYNEDGNWILTDPEQKNPHIITAISNDTVYNAHISPDGTKILYRKSATLAYYDLTSNQEFVIPNIKTNCGEAPVWAPNGYNILYGEKSCTLGWGGGILWMTDIHGNFQESIVPASNDDPGYFIFSPDGDKLLISFYNSLGSDKIAKLMGGPANFYIMTLATPVPEFPFSVPVFLAGLVSTIAIYRMKLRR